MAKSGYLPLVFHFDFCSRHKDNGAGFPPQKAFNCCETGPLVRECAQCGDGD